MLAITHHQGAPLIPWNHRMSDVPEATKTAGTMLGQNVCPSTIISYLEAYGYSWYVAQAGLREAERC